MTPATSFHHAQEMFLNLIDANHDICNLRSPLTGNASENNMMLIMTPATSGHHLQEMLLKKI